MLHREQHTMMLCSQQLNFSERGFVLVPLPCPTILPTPDSTSSSMFSTHVCEYLHKKLRSCKFCSELPLRPVISFIDGLFGTRCLSRPLCHTVRRTLSLSLNFRIQLTCIQLSFWRDSVRLFVFPLWICGSPVLAGGTNRNEEE
jgi:hypothetical protein